MTPIFEIPRRKILIGNSTRNLLEGTNGSDLILGLRGDDDLFGFDGSDFLDGGLGNDRVYGGAGNDLALGGGGDDVVDGGAGNDVVGGGQGNDRLVYVASENHGNIDRYNGGTGYDTLELVLTSAELANATLQTEIAAFRAHIAQNPSRDFFFSSLGLYVLNVENLVITEVRPVNNPPVVIPQSATVLEDDPTFAFNLLTGASDPDAGQTLSVQNLAELATSTGGRTLTLSTDYQLTGSTIALTAAGLAKFNDLADLQTDEIVFTFQVSDGTAAVANTLTVTVAGANDAPIAPASSDTISEDVPSYSRDLLAGVSDPETDLVTLSLGSLPASITSTGGRTLVRDSDFVINNGVLTLTESGRSVLQTLAATETDTFELPYDVTDGLDTTGTSFTLNVDGANDAPTVAEESDNAVVQAGASTTATGTTSFSDVDLSDEHLIDATPAAADYLGAFTPEIIDPVTGDGTGQFRWIFSVSDEELAQLTFLSTRFQIYTVAISDGAGETATQVVTIELRGAVPPPTIAFAEDTGQPGDGLTRDRQLVLNGTATPDGTVEIWLDGALIGSAPVDISGAWSFDYPSVELADGPYEFTARAQVGDALSAYSDPLAIVVDATAPVTPVVALAPSSDTGAVGDFVTSLDTVSLIGTAEAGTVLEIDGTSLRVLVGNNGMFDIPGVALSEGSNVLTVRSVDAAGNSSSTVIDVQRIAGADTADPVLAWNAIALEAIQADGSDPLFASRALAMESIAVFDVLNAIYGTPAALVGLPAPVGADPIAAIVQAAHDILTYLYPAQAAVFDARLAADLAALAEGSSRADGVALGQAVAGAVRALRENDNWDFFVDEAGGTAPGEWRATAPAFDIALSPQWALLTPFALESGSQFRPDAPPDLNSAEYAAGLEEVRLLGSATSAVRTADQTQIARFWSDGRATYTPPGHWNAIASDLAEERDLGTTENARLLASLNIALADAGVAAWDAKYFYDLWRPITAIRLADEDGNDATIADPFWSPLLLTPPFPEYVSGHSTFSGAAAAILTVTLGDGAFTTTSVGLPGVTRSYTSFAEAAEEAGRSRIYGGIHYEFANQAGQQLGQDIAGWVLDGFRTDQDVRAPIVLVSEPSGLVTNAAFTLSGFALDNLAGLDELRVALDNGTESTVAVDTTGRFSLPVSLPLDGTADGRHTLTFLATDAAGNAARPVTYAFTIDTRAPILTLDGLVDGGSLTAGARLMGTADGTGSDIVSLTYTLDDGIEHPVVFNRTTGFFSEALDLSRLAPGPTTLTVSATDAAGLTSQTSLSLTLDTRIPFAVASLTPANGAGDIGVTFRPQVTFTRPADPSTITPDTFYATDVAGARVPAHVVVAPDGMRAWLFFDQPLAGSSTVKLNLDGDAIRAADSVLLDGDRDGLPGGDLVSSFSTVSRTILPNTSITGFVVGPGPDLRPMTFDDMRAGPDGAVFTGDDLFREQLAGVKVFILGLENKAVFTDAEGRFTLDEVPAGTVKLAIDGRTATNAPAGVFFPEMVMDLQIRPGRVNTVMGTMGSIEEQVAHLTRGEVYLPRLSTDMLTEISDTAATAVTASAAAAPNLTAAQRAQVQLIVQPGSAIGEDGQPLADAQVGIATVPPELVRDMLPAGLLQHTFDITIQAPDTAVFATPLELTLPNVFNAAPGTKLNLLSFDHTTGRLVIEGTATVSADGLSVTTDPNTGITHPGWHGFTPPGVPLPNLRPQPSPDPDCFDGNIKLLGSASGLVLGLATLSAAAAGITVAPWLAATVTVVSLVAVANGVYERIQSGQIDVTTEEGAYGAKQDIISLLGAAFEKGSLGNLAGGLGIAAGLVDFFKSIQEHPCLAPAEKPILDDVLPIIDNAHDIIKTKVGEIIDGLGGVPDVEEGIPVVEDGKLKIVSPGPIPPVNPPPPPLDLSTLTVEQILVFLPVFIQSVNDIANAIQALNPYVPAIDAALRVAVGAVKADLQEHSLIAAPEPKALHYAVMDNLTGEVLFRGTTAGSSISAFLPPDTPLRIEAVDPVTGQFGIFNITTPSAGTEIDLARLAGLPALDKLALFPMSAFSTFSGDDDADGLLNEIEKIIGTNPRLADTDGDGVSDYAEARSGANPLDGLPVATGVLASVTLQGEARKVVVENGTGDAAGSALAYVATGDFGLSLVDVTAALRPVIRAELDLPGISMDVAVDPDLQIAAVAAGQAGVHFVDVSDPITPRLAKTISAPGGALAVETMDGIAFIGDGQGLTSFGLTTGERLQTLTLSGGETRALAREGRFLYALNSANLLNAIEVVDGVMIKRGTLNLTAAGLVIPSGAQLDILVAEGIAYIPFKSLASGGYATIDVSTPAAMSLISGPDNTALVGAGLALNGSGLGLLVGHAGAPTNQDVIDIIRAASPEDTGDFLTRLTLTQTPNSVAIANGMGFVSAGNQLQMVNYLGFDTQGIAPSVSVVRQPGDLDPLTAGIQVQEGQVVPFGIRVTDDVQVSHVELIVNGEVQRVDGSYPFDLRATLPTITANGGTTVTLQARAWDTGGNAGLSEIVTIELVPDTLAPSLLETNVDDGLVGTPFRVLNLQFSEPIDAATVGSGNVRLIELGLGEGAVEPTSIHFRNDGGTVQLTYPALPVGGYVLQLDAPSITDLAGNPLGADIITRSFTVQSLAVMNVRIASTDSAGNAASGSSPMMISADGRYVAFVSGDDNLVPGDTNSALDVVVKDMQSGAITRASTDSAGNQANPPFGSGGQVYALSISADGRYVAFNSDFYNLVGGDTNLVSDIFVKDLQTGDITRVSTDGQGGQADGPSYYSSISANGSLVAFASSSPDILVPGDFNSVTGEPNAGGGVFRTGVAGGGMLRLNTDRLGQLGPASGPISISAEGDHVAFFGAFDVLPDLPGEVDFSDVVESGIFIESGSGDDPWLATTDSLGNEIRNHVFGPFSLSADGGWIVFVSDADNLVPGDTNGVPDVFIRARGSLAITRVSTDIEGNQANGSSTSPSISADGRYVAFESAADNLVPGDTNFAPDVFVKDIQSGAILRVSTDIEGSQTSSFSGSSSPSISADGHYVAFIGPTELIPGDHNSTGGVIVTTLSAGSVNHSPTVTTIVDEVEEDAPYNSNLLAAGNAQDVDVDDVLRVINAASSITTSGGRVLVRDIHYTVANLTGAFALTAAGIRQFNSLSQGSNDLLLLGYQIADGLAVIDNTLQLTVHGLDEPVLSKQLVSQSSLSVQGNGASYDSSASADGRFVAFVSDADNLVPGDTNFAGGVFVKDMQSGAILRVSTDIEGSQVGSGFDPSISADGRYVAFASNSDNLVTDDSNFATDVFIKDLLTGTTARVSTDSQGGQANAGGFDASISGDGRYVAFTSDADNLVSDDTNFSWDIFVKDLQTGDITRVSTDSAGNQTSAGGLPGGLPGLPSSSFNPSISADGRYVAFESLASNLVTDDSNFATDVFIKDLLFGTTARVSTDSLGGQANAGGFDPVISADGRYVAFESNANNLVPDDTNVASDVFVKELLTGTITRVSTDNVDSEANSLSSNPSISADGRYVAFVSVADNLVPDDTNFNWDVFIKDLQTGAIARVSTDEFGTEGNFVSDDPSISADGRYITFDSAADNLFMADVNNASDVFSAFNPLHEDFII